MNALISPQTGQVVCNCTDGVGPEGSGSLIAGAPLFVVSDNSGTRVAGADRGGLWISGIYTQQTRRVVWAGGPGTMFSCASFDPSGRYLVAAYAAAEVFAFDLLIPHYQSVERARETPRYLGKYGNDMKTRIVGLGFVGNCWLWFSNGRKLYFCKWPEGKVVGRCTPPSPGKEPDCVWVGTRDGRLLAGVNKAGIVKIGRLKTERDEEGSPCGR